MIHNDEYASPRFPNLNSTTTPDQKPSARTLKIEEHGRVWKGTTKPKIRLIGRWLEQAGFAPGNRVLVTCVTPGVIQLQSTG